jgi:hypothetical protein
MKIMKFNEYMNNDKATNIGFINNFKLGPEWWSSWKKKYSDKYDFSYDTSDNTFNVFTKEATPKHILKYIIDDNSVYTDLDKKMMEGLEN